MEEITQNTGPNGRPTVAQLAESLAMISSVSPQATNKLFRSCQSGRQPSSPKRPLSCGGRPSALRRPLDQIPTCLQLSLWRACLPGEVPQPLRVNTIRLAEMVLGFPQGPNQCAQAMLEQSRALTLLVPQLALSSSDPTSEIASALGGSFQQGSIADGTCLAQGDFLLSVLQGMARRMQPAQSGVLLRPNTSSDLEVLGGSAIWASQHGRWRCA